jgi:PKD repeat protein
MNAVGSRARKWRSLVGVGLAIGASTVWSGGGNVAAAFAVTSHYTMNEPGGASVMADSGPYGAHGVIGADVQTGVRYRGETGYRFPWRHPDQYPARPQHLVTVDSSDHHQPGNEDFAIEFRYSTTQNFGNVLQKGQNATRGGYWKFEQPSGYMTCLFKDANRVQRAVKSPIKTNDGAWHTIRCELSDWGIRLFEDGVQVVARRTSLGSISNSWPLSIGGKSNCDQVKVSCDYFVGDIEDVKFEKSGQAPTPNQPPTASFTSSCVALDCTFDASASSDPDGQVVSRSWQFGDGASGNGQFAQHEFPGPGNYNVALTVVDDDGASDSTSGVVVVGGGEEPGDASFVAGASVVRYSSSPSVTIPSVQSGDTLLLFTTVASAVSIGEPTTSGWNAAGTAAGSKGAVRLWWKTATSSDSGQRVEVPIGSGVKTGIAVVAYRGFSSTQPVAVSQFDVQTSSSSARTTPTVGVSDPGSWVVSFWMHRDSSTTALTPPGGVVPRVSDSMSGGGRPTVLIADSGAGVSGGAGGLTATAPSSSTFGVTWSVVLRPA